MSSTFTPHDLSNTTTYFYASYRYVSAVPKYHPHPGPLGRAAFHRLVMENYLGRYLMPEEVVHHKDKNKLNNDIENLQLCASEKEHCRLHRTSPPTCKCLWCEKQFSVTQRVENDQKYAKRKYCSDQCRTEARNAAITKKANAHFSNTAVKNNTLVCLTCGTELAAGQKKYCSPTCAKVALQRAPRPTKEELYALVWEVPTSKLAQRFGVSDKAIEKRCKSYKIEKPPRGYWAMQQAGVKT